MYDTILQIIKYLKSQVWGSIVVLEKKNHFNLGNQKKTLGVKQQGKYTIRVREVCLW